MSDIIVPTTQKDLKAINAVMEEVSNSMTRMESEKDYQKEAFDELQEKYGIKAKHFRRMASDYHKDQFDKKVGEMEDYQSLYESVFETNFSVEEDEE